MIVGQTPWVMGFCPQNEKYKAVVRFEMMQSPANTKYYEYEVIFIFQFGEHLFEFGVRVFLVSGGVMSENTWNSETLAECWNVHARIIARVQILFAFTVSLARISQGLIKPWLGGLAVRGWVHTDTIHTQYKNICKTLCKEKSHKIRHFSLSLILSQFLYSFFVILKVINGFQT